ncbi:MAG: TlpA family protein disulfide reductase [Acidobacteriota bacterium]|nr:TlpA family protein disulfide reductase [Acidobacteriota bacterium]MDE3044368.1 TlpA family protein disulfide reductase [Acidobacteriota bacterium]MDE3221848.1 TlpA family protein disulfide reductase [Acidobacteriota bacterium]
MMFVSLGIGTTVAIVLILIVSLLTNARNANAPSGALPPSALVGKHVKAFSAPGLVGGTVRAPWASGHPGVVIFFASWCTPCQKELPKVAAYLDAHATGPVRVLGVDVNDANAAGSKFVRKSGVHFAVGTDPNFTITAGLFGFGQIPETVFVNAQGVVQQVYFGAIPVNQLKAGLARLGA